MKRVAIASDRQEPYKSAFCYKQDYVNEAYTSAIIKAGGAPLVLPYAEPTFAESLLSGIDGLLLIGGNDIAPVLYGEDIRYAQNVDEELDRFHMGLITYARKKGIPILGICRGFQLLNVAFGGTLYQDLEKERDSSINHRNLDKPYTASHDVELTEGTRLYSMIGEKYIGVNSLHHQGVNALGFGLTASAYAPDGLVEAFECEKTLGVQWHPEAMGDCMDTIFKDFIEGL